MPRKSLFLLPLILASSAHAEGISVVTQCKSMASSDSRTPQISISWKQSVDYRDRKGKFETQYDGSIRWDANPYSIKGGMTADLPVSDEPVPSLLPEFQVADGSAQASCSITSDKSPIPLRERRMTFKIPLTQGIFGMGAQYAVLKMALPRSRGAQIPAFGDVYITNDSASKHDTPDGGSSVGFLCSEEVHDLP